MNWKKQLSEFEKNSDWKSAILLMQDIISKNDNDIDAYLSVIYLLTNLLVEEDYNPDKQNYYINLLRKYFIDSYSKFHKEPEYLFYVGKIACISEWFFDIEIEEAQNMLKTAAFLEPHNILYKWANYNDLDMRDLNNKKQMIQYAKQALSELNVKNELRDKGALGTYLLEGLEYWAHEME